MKLFWINSFKNEFLSDEKTISLSLKLKSLTHFSPVSHFYTP